MLDNETLLTDKALTNLGNQGWELIHILGRISVIVYYFKRELPDETKSTSL